MYKRQYLEGMANQAFGMALGKGGAQSLTDSLVALMTKLRATEHHYIRCLKPNQTLKAGDWDNDFMFRQLAYSGTLEVTEIRKAGAVQDFNAGAAASGRPIYLGPISLWPISCKTVSRRSRTKNQQPLLRGSSWHQTISAFLNRLRSVSSAL